MRITIRGRTPDLEAWQRLVHAIPEALDEKLLAFSWDEEGGHVRSMLHLAGGTRGTRVELRPEARLATLDLPVGWNRRDLELAVHLVRALASESSQVEIDGEQMDPAAMDVGWVATRSRDAVFRAIEAFRAATPPGSRMVISYPGFDLGFDAEELPATPEDARHFECLFLQRVYICMSVAVADVVEVPVGEGAPTACCCLAPEPRLIPAAATHLCFVGVRDLVLPVELVARAIPEHVRDFKGVHYYDGTDITNARGLERRLRSAAGEPSLWRHAGFVLLVLGAGALVLWLLR